MVQSNRKKTNAQFMDAAKTPQGVGEAMKILKSFAPTKFDQTIEVCVHLGIDPKHADQQLRGAIAMPKGVGRSARVICFCGDEHTEAAKSAGAIEAGGADLVKKIEDGWFDFDIAIAAPDQMAHVGKLGRVLGPKGLMPSPKAGTVTADIETAVKEYSAGKLEYRNDEGGNIHCVIGKMSFSEDDLAVNLRHFLDIIEHARPASVKGEYIKRCVIGGTMTPSVRIAV